MSNDRFQRQADLVPMDNLGDDSVSVVGVGAVGRQVALQLAAIGVPRIMLYDFDTVEETNITTQGYRQQDLGKCKVYATRAAMQDLDPAIEVVGNPRNFGGKDARISPVLFCCVDSISTRQAIFKMTRDHVACWIDGRMQGETLRVLAADSPRSKIAYEATLFAQEEAQVGRCTARSTIYAATITAGLMVHQFTRWLRAIHVEQDALLNLLAGELTTETLAVAG